MQHIRDIGTLSEYFLVKKIPGFEDWYEGQFIVNFNKPVFYRGSKTKLLYKRKIQNNNKEQLLILANHLGLKVEGNSKKDVLVAIFKYLGYDVYYTPKKDYTIKDEKDFEEEKKDIIPDINKEEIRLKILKDTENLPISRFYKSNMLDPNIFKIIREYAGLNPNLDWYIQSEQYEKALRYILQKNLTKELHNFMRNYADRVDWNISVGDVILYNDVTKFYPEIIFSKITDWSYFLGAAAKSKNMKLLACMDLVKNKETFNDAILSRMTAESGSMKMLEYFLKNYIRKPVWSEILKGGAISGSRNIVKYVLTHAKNKNIQKIEAFEQAIMHRHNDIAEIISGGNKAMYNTRGYYYALGFNADSYYNVNNNYVMGGAIAAHNDKLINNIMQQMEKRGYRDITDFFFDPKDYYLMECAIRGDNKEMIDKLTQSKNNNPCENVHLSVKYKKYGLMKYFLKNCNKEDLNLYLLILQAIDKINYENYKEAEKIILYLIENSILSKEEIVKELNSSKINHETREILKKLSE